MKKTRSILLALTVACTFALPMLIPGSADAAGPVITSIKFTTPDKEMCFYDSALGVYANFGIKKANTVYLPSFASPGKFKKTKLGIAQGIISGALLTGSSFALKTKYLDSLGKTGKMKYTYMVGNMTMGGKTFEVRATRETGNPSGSLGDIIIKESPTGIILPHNMVWISCKDLPR